jgi:AGZA family xanthine/uracil permease-like MFS transporter
MLLLGNGYYTFQAMRMSRKMGRPYTAQPYGINTAAGFPFVFGIILPIMHGSLDKDNSWTGVKRVDTAFSVCIMANFITGIINLLLCIPAEHILRVFPTAAALTPLAGIGFVWLAFNQLVKCFAAPLMGLLPIFLMIFMYYTSFIPKIKGFRIPEGLLIAGLGTLLAWIAQNHGIPVSKDRLETAFGFGEDVPSLEGSFIAFTFSEIGNGFEYFGDIFGTVLPFALAASFEGVMCLVSAKKAGDPYNVRESMFVDAMGTLTSACIGSPIGTVIYIGHPVHKKVGARTGYSFFNGVAYFILCLSGLFKAFAEIFPSTAVGPVIAFFGIAMVEEAIHNTPSRHHFAVIVGLLFSIADLAYGSPGAKGAKYGGETMYKGYQGLSGDASFGKFAMHEGAPLIMMLWTGFCCYLADRNFFAASAWLAILVACAGLAIIHQPKGLPDEGDKEFTNGFYTDKTGVTGYTANSPMRFMFGYFQMLVLTLIAAGLQKFLPDYFAAPVQPDAAEDLFATWWDMDELETPAASVLELRKSFEKETANKVVKRNSKTEVSNKLNDDEI